MDYTTIDWDKLARLKPIKLWANWHINHSMGSGCYGDPPGFPSYFVRHVYTAAGNTPSKAPHYGVIVNPYTDKAYAVSEHRDWFLWSIWKPLPLNHLRTRLWIHHAYAQSHHCYGDPAYGEKQRHLDHCVIWPFPKYRLPYRPESEVMYGTTKVKIDPADYRRLLTGYRMQVKTLYQYAWSVAKDPNNHLAVLGIRRFYPEYEPELDLIKQPLKLFQADWWEREAERPAADICPGHYQSRHHHSMKLYGYCRYCGAQTLDSQVYYETLVERKEN